MLKKHLISGECKSFIQLPVLTSFILIFFCGETGLSQERELEIGLRFQKTVNLYYENGVTVQYAEERIFSKRLYLGLTYVSSRFGSAMSSNAINQDNIFLSGTYMFRPQRYLQPFLRINTGYFMASYEDPVFDVLPQSSILISPEIGISYRFSFPLKIGLSVGYNLITGNGLEGPGTLYPLFVQTSITWNILSKNSTYENNF